MVMSVRKGATQEEMAAAVNMPPAPPPADPRQVAAYDAGTATAGVAAGARLARQDPSMFAMGGDGAVRREAPAYRQSNIAGGLNRDELVRRMEMAASSMRGSPSARAAVMGVYADQIKALDQGELAKNQGNIDTDQLALKTNMDANMQQAAGKQAFGNDMGVLNRKGVLDMQVAQASADPIKNYWDNKLKEAQARKINFDIATGSDRYDVNAKAEADKALNVYIDQLVKAGVPPELALAKAGRDALNRGDLNSTQSEQTYKADSMMLADSFNNTGWGGIWADNNDLQAGGLAPGTQLDPFSVKFDTTGGSGNLYNDYIANWMPFTEKDQRMVYTDPKTGKQLEAWLDLSESRDKQIYDAFSTYSNNPDAEKMRRKILEKYK